jgi:uncharacterized integral membrane protein (TIGR00698 family)
MSAESDVARPNLSSRLIVNLPGVVLAIVTAGLAFYISTAVKPIFPVSAVVIALLLGMILNALIVTQRIVPGLTFCVKVLLRVAVALLGLRIAVSDIFSLGVGTALIVVVSMTVTIVATFAIARLLGQQIIFAALAGTATAICGASATLAVSAVLPNYINRDSDIAFTIVSVNAFSTVAMLAYPPLCQFFGFPQQSTGILLGATIHDVAQVVGAGYGISETVGNTAVVVKLFRVLLLVPVVLLVGSYVNTEGKARAGRVRVPDFAIVFLILCAINSVLTSLPFSFQFYESVKEVGGQVSNWGLLLAIAALGLNTSFRQISRVGWRHATLLGANSLILLATVLLCLTIGGVE